MTLINDFTEALILMVNVFLEKLNSLILMLMFSLILMT